MSENVRTWQGQFSAEVHRRWADTTVYREFMALVEEVGEVGRCIVKREEGTRGTPAEWIEREKLEIGQAMGVLLTITDIEGFDIVECLNIAWDEFVEMPMQSGMRLGSDASRGRYDNVRFLLVVDGQRRWLTFEGCARTLDSGFVRVLDPGIAMDLDTGWERPLTEQEKADINRASDEISASK